MYSRVFLVCLVLILASVPVHAGVPNLIAWQGVVLDSLDQPITDGSYDLHFAVYSQLTLGDSLWGETQSVICQDGVVDVLLGSVVPLPDSLFDDSVRFLQVQFENEAPYTPRVRLVAVGYALRVQTVQGARGGVIEGDVDINEDLEVAGDIRAGHVRVHTGDLREPCWETGEFDGILCSFALETLDGEGAATVLAEFRRILRPGGRLVLVHMARTGVGETAMERLYARAARRRPDLVDCRPSDFGPALERAGFRTDHEHLRRPLGLGVKVLRAARMDR